MVQLSYNELTKRLNEYPAPLPEKISPSGRNWLKIILLIFLIFAAAIIILALTFIVYNRNKQVNDLLAGQEQNGSAPAFSQLVASMLRNISSTGQTATSASTISAPIVSNIKSAQRQLIEKIDRPSFGSSTAGLVIVEFGDFECSICREEFFIIREITQKYQDRLLYIFRNYPIKSDVSGILSQAALCANEQGKFWPLHDRLYLQQGQINTPDDLIAVAKMAGVDVDKLSDCVNTQKYLSLVDQDSQDAVNLQANGTPTFFVNGSKIEGAVSAADWEKIIAKYEQVAGNK